MEKSWKIFLKYEWEPYYKWPVQALALKLSFYIVPV